MIIYRVTNLINGKVYIGQTVKSLCRRRGQHIQDMKRHHHNSHFHNAIKTYGIESFEWEIVAKCRSKDDMNLQETLFIAYHGSFCRGRGYNKTLGGEGIRGFMEVEGIRVHMKQHNPMKNPEAVEKASRTKKQMRELYGKRTLADRVGEEVAEKMRSGASSRMTDNNPMSNPETARKVAETKRLSGYYESDRYNEIKGRQIAAIRDRNEKKWLITTPDGDIIEITGLSKFCQERGLVASCMTLVAQGKRKQHKKYKCQYVEE